MLDADTGAVLAVVGAALEAGRAAAGFALPLCATRAAEARRGPLGELLRAAALAPGSGPVNTREPSSAVSACCRYAPPKARLL
ncbi:hypothetical protein [Streptomyces chengmaiensis]|uniref:hypothetical protein n=1 Tax=Streptomyces chengmaiensis TaxID=3040919 RepID=UPI0037DA6AE5